MQMQQVFNYKAPFLLNAISDGSHKSRRHGIDGEFYRKSPFLSDPAPNRIDLLQSVKDPFETMFVKSFRQQNKLQVLTLVDGSSSMRLADKPDIVAECMFSIQQSVYAMNDNHDRYLLTDRVQQLPASTLLSDELAQLNMASQTNNDAYAFSALTSLLPTRAALVFLISDFHWSDMKIAQVLQSLQGHIVVPLVIWLQSEYQNYPLWRFVNVTDSETGQSQLVFVTPHQRQQIEQSFELRKQHLNQMFNQFQRRPVWFFDHYCVQSMRRYFNV
ncbi:hypothetical protein MPL1_13237 [Methylophaga lonarensis MPL]|uniref:DUF58 domain-containing protein n=1 Tax=Methylophaga lonarensis MPL TaxID=1286106 RepID=M7PDB9_9GAMM|nr:hypothetical protein [Methylophaga lonarensis]EMR11885.1 hypothetical protein MPL1_13237 [Methylophaga lonarensis MPL]